MGKRIVLNYSVVHVLDQKVHNPEPGLLLVHHQQAGAGAHGGIAGAGAGAAGASRRVSPGLIYVSGPQSEANFQRARCVNLLRAPIDPARVAQTVAFLADNPSLNGAVVPVDSKPASGAAGPRCHVRGGRRRAMSSTPARLRRTGPAAGHRMPRHATGPPRAAGAHRHPRLRTHRRAALVRRRSVRAAGACAGGARPHRRDAGLTSSAR